MSHSAGLEVVVIGLVELIAAAVEAGGRWNEQRKLQTDDGKTHAVDGVVVDEHTGARVGVKIDPKTKVATFIAQDCKGKKGKALAARVAQRYAYARVTEEMKRKGYQVAKDEVKPDGSIALVFQKWG